MKLRNLTAMMALAAILPSFGAEISPAEALQRAKLDSPAKMARGVGKTASPKLVHTATTTAGAPAVYLFNNPSGEGFVALSADDCALPLLGYSDKWTFSADEMPPQLKWWLSEYASQIEYARKNNIDGSSTKRKFTRSGERAPIAPMVTTKWDQIAPYNNQCPLSGTDRTWTGCVATAMAQVMKYWNYPEKGEGTITYSIDDLEKKVSLNFGLKTFDWENMLDLYAPGQYTNTEADAVAYLMKACGYAVKMQYGMDSSGALGMNIGNAFKKYFKYDGNTLYTLRQYYSSAQWDEMMYNNLKNVGPVVYGGGSMLGGGHSFVCDGYDGEGLYHFNWGWSGMSDGYFSLDALNPDALGTGGGAGGGYNFDQDAVFGIQPPTGEPVVEQKPFITQQGEISGKIQGMFLNFSLVNAGDAMWINYSPNTQKVKFGAMFVPQGENAGDSIYYDLSSHRLSLQPGYGTSPDVLGARVNLRTLDLADGTYKVTCGSVPIDSAEESDPTNGEGFMPVKPCYGCSNYVILKVANGKYSVTNELLPELKVKGEILSPLYDGALVTVKVTVENPGDIDRVSGFAPAFFDAEVGFDQPIVMGESIFLSIPAHSTVTKEWSTSLATFVTQTSPFYGRTFTFSFFNEYNFDFYLDQFKENVVFNAIPNYPVVKQTKPFTIPGSYRENNITIIRDASSFDISTELTLTSGYFNYPVVLCLGSSAGNDQVMIENTSAVNTFLTTAPEGPKSATLNFHMSNPIVDYTQTYYLILTYQINGGLYPITQGTPVRFADPSGVNDIEIGNGFNFSYDRNAGTASISSENGIAAVNVFDITGRRADNGIAINGTTASVKLNGEGLYIIRVTDANGNEKTFKLK